jgi:hypothetical protein
MNGRLIVLMRSIHRDLDAIATIYDKLERYSRRSCKIYPSHPPNLQAEGDC